MGSKQSGSSSINGSSTIGNDLRRPCTNSWIRINLADETRSREEVDIANSPSDKLWFVEVVVVGVVETTAA